MFLQESTTWVEKDMSLATPDQQSFSSEEDEEEGTGRQREFTTGSSDDEESSLSDRRFKLTSGGKRQDGDIGKRREISSIARNASQSDSSPVMALSSLLMRISLVSASHWTKNPSKAIKKIGQTLYIQYHIWTGCVKTVAVLAIRFFCILNYFCKAIGND